jgi:hypothetical protein
MIGSERTPRGTVALPLLNEALSHLCLLKNPSSDGNRFANEDRDQRYSAIDQSIALLRRGLPA